MQCTILLLSIISFLWTHEIDGFYHKSWALTTRLSTPISTKTLPALSLSEQVDTWENFSSPGPKEDAAISFQRYLYVVTDPTASSQKKISAFQMIAKTRQYKKYRVDLDLKILRYVEAMVDELDVTTVVPFVTSISRNSFLYSKAQNRLFFNRLIQKVNQLAGQLHPNSIALCIIGLANADVNMNSTLPDGLWPIISYLIESVLKQHSFLSPTISESLFYALYSKKFRWDSVSVRGKKGQVTKGLHVLLENMVQRITEMKENVLWATAVPYYAVVMGLNERAMSRELENIILKFSVAILTTLNLSKEEIARRNNGKPFELDLTFSTSTSNMVYTLGKLGYSYKQLPPVMINDMYSALINYTHEMDGRELSATFYGLGSINAPWNSLPGELKKALIQRCMKVITSMNAQSMTNVLYGLCLMQAPLSSFPSVFKDLVHDHIVDLFTLPRYFLKGNKQAISNTLYSFANTGYQWTDFPEKTRQAFIQGLITYSDYFIPQELSVAISSMGALRAPYAVIAKDINPAISKCFVRLEPELKTLHSICTLISGFAKMGATWNTLPNPIRDVAIRVISAGRDPTALSVPCIINNFAQMGVKWKDFASDFRVHLASLSNGLDLTEQGLGNTVFALGLMGAQWSTLEQPLKDVVYRGLSNPMALAEHIPQHVSNVIWGMSKLEIPKDDPVWENILRTAVPSIEAMTVKELSQVMYGLGYAEFSWREISVDLLEATAVRISENSPMYSSQDIANFMYSLGFLIYDFDLSILDASPKEQAQRDEDYRKAYAALLWMEYLLEKFSVSSSEWIISSQQYDQYQIFLNFLSVIPSKVVQELVQKFFPNGVPSVSGPSATVTSKTHSRIHNVVQRLLLKESPKFSLFNEFVGCGIFATDMAVYYEDNIIAFVEVDGSFHYHWSLTNGDISLRRVDRLKEYLYRNRYPTVPIIRIAASRSSLNIIGQLIVDLLLQEFNPNQNIWRKEWKCMILRDHNMYSILAREELDRQQSLKSILSSSSSSLSTQSSSSSDSSTAASAVVSLYGDISPEDFNENEFLDQEFKFEESNNQNFGVAPSLDTVMDITVRRLIPRGTMYEEVIVPYAQEVQQRLHNPDHQHVYQSTRLSSVVGEDSTDDDDDGNLFSIADLSSLASSSSPSSTSKATSMPEIIEEELLVTLKNQRLADQSSLTAASPITDLGSVVEKKPVVRKRKSSTATATATAEKETSGTKPAKTAAAATAVMATAAEDGVPAVLKKPLRKRKPVLPPSEDTS